MSTTTDSISVQAAERHPLPEYSAGQQVGGQYEILEKLGEGLLGAVYKAKAKSGGIKAVKFVRQGLLGKDASLDKFNLGVQAFRTLKHPGILSIQETGEHDGTLFFTTEFMDGGSLRDLLDGYRSRGEDMPPAQMKHILLSTLKILQAVHSKGLHRNLKPENILLRKTTGADGKPATDVLLSDFGLASLISPSVFTDSELNREGAWYLAPEMGEFQAKADASSDLYSLGAIFYEMLTGSPPIGRYLMPSELRHGEISAKIDDLVEISLNPNPQDRFQTASDMVNALETTFADVYGGGDTNPVRTLILLGLLIVVSIIAAVYFKASEPTPQELQAASMEHLSTLRAANKGQPAGTGAPASSDPKYADMVWIPGGSFVAGHLRAYAADGSGLIIQEGEEHVVEVEGYWIDKYELHIPRMAASPEDDEQAAEEKRTFNAEQAGKLKVDVTWADAKGLCEAQGKRLCNAEEWEKACKGPDNQIYAYGNEFDGTRCPQSGYVPSYKADQHPACGSGYGVLNLSGGAAEWTSTPKGGNYLVKPGGLGKDDQGTRCASAVDRSPTFGQVHVGVRCCAG